MAFTELITIMTQTLIFAALYIIGVWIAYQTGKVIGYDEFFRDFKRIEKENFELYKKATNAYFEKCSKEYNLKKDEKDS